MAFEQLNPIVLAELKLSTHHQLAWAAAALLLKSGQIAQWLTLAHGAVWLLLRHCMVTVAQPKKAAVIGRGCALLGMYGTRYPLHYPNLLVAEAVWTDDRLCHETVAERELTMSCPRCFLHISLTLVAVRRLPLRVVVGGLGQWLSISKGAMSLQPRLPVQVALRAQVRLPMRFGWYSHSARFAAHRQAGAGSHV